MRNLSIIAAVVVLAACHREPQPPAKAFGPPMPPYKAQWLDGKSLDIEDEKGTVVLLNIWATWCGPCRFEIPELGKLHAKYASRGFKVIGVSVDEGGAGDVKQFVADQKIVYPIALDPEGKLATLLKTTVIPTSIVVDRTGNVVWKHFGIVDMNDATLTKAVESALAR